MATQVASLFGVLSLDDADFQQGLKDADKGMKSAQDRLKDFSAGIKNVGAGMIAASGPIVAFGVSSVKAAMDSQNAVAQLEAVIKSTGGSAGVTADHAQALASSLQNLTMFGDEATLSAESMLLTFTNIGAAGGIFDQATLTALNMSQALGQDLTSSAMQLGKALNNPVDGITALTRVGVTFTEQQKEQIKAMTEAGNIAGAQTVILAELNKEFGGSALAAGSTFSGALEILKNKFGEVQEKIGAAFLPALTDITKQIGPIVDNIAKWVEQNPTLVLQIGAVAVGGLALGTALVVIGTVLPAVVAGIGLLVSPVVILAVALGALVYAAANLYPGGIAQLLTDASIAAQQLVQMGLLILVDTLNKASIAATMLIGIIQIGFVTTINNASIAATNLIGIVGDWITKNSEAIEKLENLGISIGIVVGAIKLYTGVTALASLASGGLSAAAVAAAGAIAGIVGAAVSIVIPLTAAIAVVYAAVTAFRELIKAHDDAVKAVKEQAANAAPGIAANNYSLQDVKDKAFAASQAEYGGGFVGDLRARLLWGSGIVGMDQRVTDLYNTALNQKSGAVQTDAGRRAGGGSVYAGMPYIVGEQGPELFTPSTSGNISTAQQTAGMMGGMHIGAVNVYANSYEQGAAAAAGFMDKARSMGYSFG